MACFLSVNTFMYSQAKWVSLDNSPVGTLPTIEVLKSDNLSYQIRVSIHGFYDEQVVKEAVVYHRISFGDDVTTAEIGFPAMPIISQLIALPTRGEYSSSVLEKKWADVSIGKIYPYQKPLLETESPTKIIVNNAVYNQELYTIPLVSNGNVSVWRDVHNVTFSLCPFKYYPKNGNLSVLSEFVFKVEFSVGKDAFKHQAIAKSDLTMFDNNFSTLGNKLVTDNASYDYLIIVGDNDALLKSQTLSDFCKWKAVKGYKTKVVSTSFVGKSCLSIKKYIANEYRKGIKYVLFIGDDDRIPLYDRRSSQTGGIIESDYWYGCMDGDDDVQSDLVIGRFSTNSVTDLQNMVNKTIKYESSDNQYAQDVQLVANSEDAPFKYQNCCEQIRIAAYRTPLNFKRTYGATASYGGTNSTNADIISQINHGVNIVNYRGHGDWDRWICWNFLGQDFLVNDIGALANTTYPIVFGVACTTADIRNHTCLLETFMRSKHGSVAYIGATIPSYTTANHSFNKILFSELLNNDIANVGELNVRAHIRNISAIRNFTAIDNAFCYVCGSDPALEIWTQKPKTFRNVTALRQQDGLHITVNGVVNYTISVLSKNGSLRYKVESSSNSVKLPDYQSGDLIYLNKRNYIPLEVKPQGNSQNTVYVQNRIFTNDEVISGNKIEMGYDVTPSIQYGKVLIKKDAKLRLRSSSGTILKNGVECEKGATLIIE